MFALDVAAHTGPWRLRHPAEKALLSLGLLACAVALPPWPGAVLSGGAAAALLLGPARVSPAVVLRAARVPLLFVATSAVPLLVTMPAPARLAVDPAGPALAAQTAGRSVAALTCLLLFSATTPLSDVLPRLHRLGIPPAVTEVAALTYRMLFLLVDSVRAVREAQAARLGFRTWRTAYASLAGQAGAVFVRAFSRARRLEEGLALRGYTGSLTVQVEPRRMSPPFVAATVGLLVAIVAATTVAGSRW
ncbi:cobalt/nickel transport system permease protein [Micromonospora echinaurantiaca]|uniref:Cobalt/nickel transport system permease protein n=1 Tax=Micromonospora echinaurantiaca TaxID=47857 RepID=A0A1C5HIT1_9ACTN|nr:cobalt ECF transporter T component CbiQ [Micromonospora echinaurantiaca]SCG45431.1 cobalt/nickel transport system permease protein [Micromonospora echinaurantiaca]